MVSGEHSAAGKAGAAARNVAEHIGDTPRTGRAQVAGTPHHQIHQPPNRMQGNIAYMDADGPARITETDWYGRNVESALDNMRKYLNNAEIARALQGVGPVAGEAATAGSKLLNIVGAGMGAVEIPMGFFREFHENRQLPALLRTISHTATQGPLTSSDLAPEVLQILGQDAETAHNLWAEGTLSDELYGELVPMGERMRLTERPPAPQTDYTGVPPSKLR